MIDLANQILAAPNAQAAAATALGSTDWTQIPNSGLTNDCVAAFATYRSAVRVIRRDSTCNNFETSNSDYTLAVSSERRFMT